ncbi:MAG: hypothetical protein Roseis2KO_20980 [Roseivirga sp.]
MKKLMVLLLITVSLQSLRAQGSMLGVQEDLKKLSSKIDRSNRDKRSPDYTKSFDKTPLVFQNWYYGKLLFSDNTEMDSVRFNFDIDLNTIVVQYNEAISAVNLKPDVVKSFILHDGNRERSFVRKQKGDFNDIKYRMPFFEVVLGEDTGKGLSIIKQYLKTEVSEDNQSSYKPVGFKANGEQTIYDFKALYFIKTENDASYGKFGLTKKKVLSLFDKAKSKEVQGYVKSNKLKWNDESQMMALLREFYQQ